jgi:hypothetical protein
MKCFYLSCSFIFKINLIKKKLSFYSSNEYLQIGKAFCQIFAQFLILLFFTSLSLKSSLKINILRILLVVLDFSSSNLSSCPLIIPLLFSWNPPQPKVSPWIIKLECQIYFELGILSRLQIQSFYTSGDGPTFYFSMYLEFVYSFFISSVMLNFCLLSKIEKRSIGYSLGPFAVF